MSIIDNDPELNRIVDSMNLDEHEFIDLLMEQPGDLSHEHTGIRIVRADTNVTALRS